MSLFFELFKQLDENNVDKIKISVESTILKTGSSILS